MIHVGKDVRTNTNYQKHDESKRRRAPVNVIILFVPFLVISGYLLVSRIGNLNRSFDYIAFGISLLGGLPFSFRFADRTSVRIAISILYFIVGWVLLTFYAVLFVCIVFKDCI
jgi:hypothetical protein